MPVSKRLRHEVMRRDGHRCKYCGAAAQDVKLTIDHVVPTTLGGSDEPSNLVTACADCNAGKSATPPDAALVADVDEKALRWAQAMDTVVAQRAAELAADRKRLNKFDRKWRSYRTYGEHYPRDANWRNSITRFMASGLDDQFLSDAVETAVGKPRMPPDDVWKYFCGICWREIDDLQKRAAALAAGAAQPDLAAAVVIDSRMDQYYGDKQAELNFAHTEAQAAIVRKLSKLLFRTDRMDGTIAGVTFNACAEAERIFAVDLSDVPAVDKAMVEIQTYVDELFRKESIGRPPDFDFMNMADSFMSDLTLALGGDEQVVKFANDALWRIMPDAYDEWRRHLETQGEHYDPNEQTVDEYATEMALELFNSSTAPYMHEIAQWRKAKDEAAVSQAAHNAAGDVCPSTS